MRARGGWARYPSLAPEGSGGTAVHQLTATEHLHPRLDSSLFKRFFPSVFPENLWGAGWWGMEVHLSSSPVGTWKPPHDAGTTATS